MLNTLLRCADLSFAYDLKRIIWMLQAVPLVTKDTVFALPGAEVLLNSAEHEIFPAHKC